MKTKVSVIAIVMALVACFGITAFANDNACGTNVYWKIEDETLVIYGNGLMYDFDANTRPGYEDYRSEFSNVVIEDGVKRIGNYAFYAPYRKNPQRSAFNYDNLTGSLSIPDSVTAIGDRAFYMTTFDGSLSLGNGVTYIGNSAFAHSGFKGNLILPDSLTDTGESAFSECAFDGELKLSSSMTRIAPTAFFWCEYLTGDLVIPDGVKLIGTSAFSGLYSMTGHLNLGNVEVIDPTAFSKCGFTGRLTIPDTVKSISTYAFRECKGFDSLDLGQVEKLYNGVFYNCAGLHGVLTLPETLNSMGDCCFHGCAQHSGIREFFRDYPDLIEFVETDYVEPHDGRDGYVEYVVNCTANAHRQESPANPKYIMTYTEVIPAARIDAEPLVLVLGQPVPVSSVVTGTADVTSDFVSVENGLITPVETGYGKLRVSSFDVEEDIEVIVTRADFDFPDTIINTGTSVDFREITDYSEVLEIADINVGINNNNLTFADGVLTAVKEGRSEVAVVMTFTTPEGNTVVRSCSFIAVVQDKPVTPEDTSAQEEAERSRVRNFFMELFRLLMELIKAIRAAQ